MDELEEIVATNNKQRYEFSEDKTRIRARQGHSVEVDVELEVFDTSGRLLWRKSETGIPTDHTYTIDWDLTTGSGSRLKTGVYLYRALISNNGSSKASQAKKLIVLGQ